MKTPLQHKANINILFISLFLTVGCNTTDDRPIKYQVGASSLNSSKEQKGSLFISPQGKGDACTKKEPCNIKMLDYTNQTLNIKAGTVVFFRGGVYSYSMDSIRRIYLPGGSKEEPITYESYPNELAIFDGLKLDIQDESKKEWREGRLELHGNYIRLRNIEVRNMPQYGIRIFGNHNIVEGCIVHHNHLSGIEILNNKDGYSSKDTGGSYNIVQNNIIYDNSDVTLKYGNYNNGGNADGVTIHSGIDNLIKNNTIYGNSDDGVDTYKSIHTRVEYNVIYDHGRGEGNANGIKLGGPDKQLSINSVATHNILYKNKGFGITVHGEENNTTVLYNTSYNNEKAGYAILDDTILSYNISTKDQKGEVAWSEGKTQDSNSWQFPNKIEFVSLDKNSTDFLRPTLESNLTDIGAYASELKE